VKVSVLMPTYDCPPRLLEKSILSVERQSHTDFEIVIKDGCLGNPALNDARIAGLFRDLGPRIQYILSPDGPPPEQSGAFKHNGFYDALNEAIKVSTGEILTLLCSDDDRGPADTLTHVVHEFEQHGPSPFFLYGQSEWIDLDDKTLEIKQPWTIPVTYDSLRSAYTLYTPALFWNRAVHDKFGLFDSVECPWSADLDFWLRCWRGIDTKYSPKILGRYRNWEVSQCRSNNAIMCVECEKIMRRHP
jgi:hypothetical protein